MLISDENDLRVYIYKLAAVLSSFGYKIKHQKIYEIFAKSQGCKTYAAFLTKLPVCIDDSMKSGSVFVALAAEHAEGKTGEGDLPVQIIRYALESDSLRVIKLANTEFPTKEDAVSFVKNELKGRFYMNRNKLSRDTFFSGSDVVITYDAKVIFVGVSESGVNIDSDNGKPYFLIRMNNLMDLSDQDISLHTVQDSFPEIKSSLIGQGWNRITDKDLAVRIKRFIISFGKHRRLLLTENKL